MTAVSSLDGKACSVKESDLLASFERVPDSPIVSTAIVVATELSGSKIIIAGLASLMR